MIYTSYKDHFITSLEAYFDIEENIDIDQVHVDVLADYKRRNERYILLKKNVLYGYNNFEHFMLLKRKKLHIEDLKKELESIEAWILSRIDVNSDHMSTDYTLCYFLDEISPEVKTFVRKYKWRKMFSFGLKGRLHIGLTMADTTGQYIPSKDRRGKRYSFLNSNIKKED